MFGYIYKTTNLINDKIYVGQHKKKFFDKNYYGSGSILNKSIKTYGIENFKCEIVDSAETKEELNKKEIYWIDKLNSRNRKIGYNIRKGGELGSTFNHTKEAKEKISLHNAKYWYGKSRSKITNLKISKKLKNRKRSKESILKQINTNKNRTLSEKEIQQRKNIHLGKKVNNQTKIKISLSLKGRKWMNNSIIEIQIKPEDFDKYLNNGFVIGRKRRTK